MWTQRNGKYVAVAASVGANSNVCLAPSNTWLYFYSPFSHLLPVLPNGHRHCCCCLSRRSQTPSGPQSNVHGSLYRRRQRRENNFVSSLRIGDGFCGCKTYGSNVAFSFPVAIVVDAAVIVAVVAVAAIVVRNVVKSSKLPLYTSM